MSMNCKVKRFPGGTQICMKHEFLRALKTCKLYPLCLVICFCIVKEAMCLFCFDAGEGLHCLWHFKSLKRYCTRKHHQYWSSYQCVFECVLDSVAPVGRGQPNAGRILTQMGYFRGSLRHTKKKTKEGRLLRSPSAAVH